MTHIDEAVERLRNGLGFIGFRAEKLLRQELSTIASKSAEETVKMVRTKYSVKAADRMTPGSRSQELMEKYDKGWEDALEAVEEALSQKESQ